MLRSLRVRDLATVADATLEFTAGLNVLTGETGAGKSMLVDAVALILGDRSDRAAVRPGSDRAVVEAEFTGTVSLREHLAEIGLDPDDMLVIRREVQQEGRSRAWVNGSPVAIAVLREIGSRLADMHGQHQTVELSDAVRQLALIDSMGRATSLLEAVGSSFRALKRRSSGSIDSGQSGAVRRAVSLNCESYWRRSMGSGCAWARSRNWIPTSTFSPNQLLGASMRPESVRCWMMSGVVWRLDWPR